MGRPRHKLTLLVCAFVAGLAGPARSVAQDSLIVTRDGKAACAIVTVENAGEPRLSLARELGHWLQQITGASLPVETVAKPRDGILLGTANDFPREAQELKLKDLGPEGFILRSEAKRLLILGNTELALQHAVFVFLESLGCRWYFPDPVWTVTPRRPSLTVRMDRREQPAYAFRQIWYGWAARTPKLEEDYRAWSRHNRQHWNGSPLASPFQVDTSHSYARHIPKGLFKEHPEWFSLVKGERRPRQLCLSNQAVQDRVVESVLNSFRKDAVLNMVSVDPDDGGDHCECDPCKAMGTISDRVFHLANLAADAVRKEFPNKWVGLNAYSFHAEPPGGCIHPGVYVSVTTRFRKTQLSFEDQMRRFKELGATVGVYEYFSVYPWDWDMPGAALGGRATLLGALIKRYHKDFNVTSLCAESSCNWGPNGLGYWIAAKMMWNPNLKPEELAADFYANAFGKAAAPMKRLYERWNSGDWFVIRQGAALSLRDLAEAYKAEGDPMVRARLDRVAMYLHWLRLNDDRLESVVHQGNRNEDVGTPEEIVRSSKEMIVYSRRIMDTGLVHTFPMLFEKGWFENRFGTLKSMGGMDFKEAEAWKTERTDIPTPEEVAKNFSSDLASHKDVIPVQPEGRTFSENLVAVKEVLPAAVKEWSHASPSGFPVKSGEYVFRAKRGEKVRVNWRPLDGNTAIKAHWRLRRIGEAKDLAEGRLASEKGQPAQCEVDIPSDGVFVIAPGHSEAGICGAEIDLGSRPQVAFAGRYWDSDPLHVIHDEFILWRPEMSQALYFFVPKGTRRFVIGLDGTREYSKLRVETPNGKTIIENDRMTSSIPSYRSHGERVAVSVPPGQDGKIWSILLESYLCTLELYDVPPYVARHPTELLVPAEVAR